MISIADAFTDQYPSTTAFMAALADQINIEMRRRGCPGAELVELRWTETPGGPPVAAILAREGARPLTVERLREAYQELLRKRQPGDGR